MEDWNTNAPDLSRAFNGPPEPKPPIQMASLVEKEMLERSLSRLSPAPALTIHGGSNRPPDWDAAREIKEEITRMEQQLSQRSGQARGDMDRARG